MRGKWIAGYLFNPDHIEVHWMHNPKGRTYSGTFSTDISYARRYESKSDIVRVIKNKVSKFEDHWDYNWTPVVKNIETAEVWKFITV